MRWLVIILLLTTVATARLRSDLNGDNKVDIQDFAIMASEWLQREPDFLLKIKEYEGKRKLTVREKQMLHVARLKYLAYLEAN